MTQQGEVMDQVGRLVELEELRRLKARYWRYVDTKQWDAFGALFTEEATFDDPAASFHCRGRAEIQSRISAGFSGVVTVHHGHQYELEIDESGVRATGIWAMADLLVFPSGSTYPTASNPPSVVRGYGHYIERYERVAGEWRFAAIELSRLHLETVTHGQTPVPDALLDR